MGSWQVEDWKKGIVVCLSPVDDAFLFFSHVCVYHELKKKRIKYFKTNVFSKTNEVIPFLQRKENCVEKNRPKLN